jgi:hypothetical protein
MSSENRARLFVHADPAALNVPKLQEYFQQFGNVTDLYVPTNRQTGEPKGIAFVTYEDGASIDSALAVENHELAGLPLSVKKAEPRAKAVYQTSGASMNNSDHYRIFIPELPTAVVKTDLEEYFSQYGEVKDVHLPPLNVRGHGTGRQVAFVTFKTAEVTNKVLEQKHSVGGQEFEIKRAAERPPTNKGEKGGKGGSSWGGGSSYSSSSQGNGKGSYGGGKGWGGSMGAGYAGNGMGMSNGMGMGNGMGIGMAMGNGMGMGMGADSAGKAFENPEVAAQVQQQVQQQVQLHLQMLHQVRLKCEWAVRSV